MVAIPIGDQVLSDLRIHYTMFSYIVDWEEWTEASDQDGWRNNQYIGWNLARVKGGSYNDMSTWIL
jgi:hypothetical protein